MANGTDLETLLRRLSELRRYATSQHGSGISVPLTQPSDVHMWPAKAGNWVWLPDVIEAARAAVRDTPQAPVELETPTAPAVVAPVPLLPSVPNGGDSGRSGFTVTSGHSSFARASGDLTSVPQEAVRDPERLHTAVLNTTRDGVAVRDTPQPQPAAVTVDDVGDAVCQHGTAMDVHCCNCHSGFIFDMHHECPVSSMADAAEMLWVVLANVSGGDWTKQSADWQEAAARWRDNYFQALKAGRDTPPPQGQAEK